MRRLELTDREAETLCSILAVYLNEQTKLMNGRNVPALRKELIANRGQEVSALMTKMHKQIKEQINEARLGRAANGAS